MEVLDKKLHQLRAEAAVESFFPFAPIGSVAHQFLVNSTSTMHHITSILVSKIGVGEKKDQTAEFESFYPEGVDAKNVYALANDPTTAASLLDNISQTCPVSILESIAANESASKITLQRLADHDSPQVRAAVIENRNVPFRVLVCLCEDEHPDVRFAMAANPHMPRSLLAKLITDENPYVASRACATLERLL